jgi:CDP-diacylglycerol--glycerol-3-phosphate 3-phosphatidyltransferase
MINLANKITLSRIFLILPVLALLHHAGPAACWLAAILFTIASLTDLLDGHIARRDNTVTSLGKLLDPLADKLLVGSVLIMFVELGWTPAWIAIAVIMREMAVTGLRAMAVSEGVVLAADNYGKFKTIMQVVALVPLIVHYPFLGFDPQPPGNFLLYIALVLTVFSGVHYCYTFYLHWRSDHPARESGG